jgi:SMC interacting uncharacterized protein involved in chromosome segregation
MAESSPSPNNDVLLRQMQGIRRDIQETHERESRLIELIGRLAMRMDEGFNRVRDDIGAVRDDIDSLRRDIDALRGDNVLMENRVLTAISEVPRLSERIDTLADGED